MSKSINLEINGKLFPSWILLNFKNYELPEIMKKDGEDPCKIKIKKELTLYQQFIGKFLDYKSAFRDILLYHGLGSGKTATAINIYNVLYNYTPKWNVFLLIKASLKDDPWLKDLKEWLTKKDKDNMMKNIVFINYDSPFADSAFLDAIKNSDGSKQNLFIIDEVHNFINNVYNNIYTKQGKRAQVIYDYIQNEKIENNNTRIVLLSATPVINNPFEFVLIYNLLRPNTFSDKESEFEQLFISSSNFKRLDVNKKNLFQRRIMGLTSYYLGATPDKFAKKKLNFVEVPMEEYQEEIYEYYENIENRKNLVSSRFKKGKIKNNLSTYATYTRQSCNFVFPFINKTINGETRPRPGDFRIKDIDAVTLDEGKEQEKKLKLLKKDENKKYKDATNNFILELVNYFKDILRKDKSKKYTLNDDIKKYFGKYKEDYNEFLKDKTKSNLLKEFLKCSPKIVMIIFKILGSPGPVLFYSNYVEMEGIHIFKIYLNFFGFSNIIDKKDSKDGFIFMEYHGGIDSKVREANKLIFNSSENKTGKKIKIILISPAGAEGITTRNVRQVHILEPYWNEVRIEQVIGRAIRQCNHVDLPMNEREVEVYRYKMVRNNNKETSDQLLERISRRKNNLLLSFYEAIKEVAIDCELFKNHNMLASDYKCFKFNEDSLTKKIIGPAYNKNLEIDIKMDDGLNSLESIHKKIKVREIKVVKKINEKSYSDEFKVWVNDENNHVYDYNLHYLIGKLLSENNFPAKLNKNVYIIGELIEIPELTFYD
jgi:superfamily II DNA or RNA helicase